MAAADGEEIAGLIQLRQSKSSPMPACFIRLQMRERCVLAGEHINQNILKPCNFPIEIGFDRRGLGQDKARRFILPVQGHVAAAPVLQAHLIGGLHCGELFIHRLPKRNECVCHGANQRDLAWEMRIEGSSTDPRLPKHIVNRRVGIALFRKDPDGTFNKLFARRRPLRTLTRIRPVLALHFLRRCGLIG